MREPRDQTTRIVLTSSDVNHAFWIPAFLFKRDAIPGRVTSFDLRPEQSGTYAGSCAEFCGYAHALMGFSVSAAAAEQCPTRKDEIATDRPDVTNSSLVVPTGSFQSENGINLSRRDGATYFDGTNSRLRSTSTSTTLRFSVVRRITPM